MKSGACRYSDDQMLFEFRCLEGAQAGLSRETILRKRENYRGLVCALLNIRSVEALLEAPAAGAIWETFVCAQLQVRERRAGRIGSLFFWRDRTPESRPDRGRSSFVRT